MWWLPNCCARHWKLDELSPNDNKVAKSTPIKVKTFKIVIPYVLALILINFLILNKNGSIYKFSEDKLQFSKKIIIISFVGIMVWFIKAPDYRYGSGYIISFTSLLFSFIVIKNKVHNKINKFIFPIIGICFLFFLTKNLNRIFFFN